MSLPHRHSLRFLDSAIPAAILALALVSGCGRAPGTSAPASVPPQEGVLVDAANADEVLACAEEQFGTHGSFVHRDTKDFARSIRASRETPTTGDSYELNVTGAGLSPVAGNPNLLRLMVSSETRLYRSRGYNEGFYIRPTPRSDVVQLAQSVLATCGKR